MTTWAEDRAPVEALLRRVRVLELRVNRLLDAGLAGTYRSVFRGRGLEAEGVREYTYGDDAAVIDWLVSARANRTHVRVFREERELRCLLLVDVSASMRCRPQGFDPASTAADLAALLALAAGRNRDRVGLLLFSDAVEDWLPPSRSPQQALRLIRAIVGADPRGEGTDLALALTTATRLESQRGLVILISDMQTPVPEPEVARLLRRQDLLVLHLVGPAEPEWPVAPVLWVEDAESQRVLALRPSREAQRDWQEATRQQARAARAAVCRYGGDWVDIPCGTAALTTLAAFLSTRARGSRRAGGRREGAR